jgi:hypothetical protein
LRPERDRRKAPQGAFLFGKIGNGESPASGRPQGATMLGLLIAVAVLVLIAVVPVMIGARVVGASNTGFGASLLAVVMLAVLGAAIGLADLGPVLQFLISAVIGAFLLAGILGTTFWRGMGVSAIAVALQVGAALVFAGSIAALAS